MINLWACHEKTEVRESNNRLKSQRKVRERERKKNAWPSGIEKKDDN